MPCGSCFSRVALVGLKAAGSAVTLLACLLVLVVLAGLSPRAVLAQAPIVTITPPPPGLYTVADSAYVEIEWCANPPDYYDPSTRFIRFDGVSVLHLFTTTNTDAWQHPECDYQWEISKGWIPLVKTSQTLSAQVSGYNGWAGGESVVFQRPTQWTSITVAAERSLLEPGALQAASLRIEVTNNSAVTDTVLLSSPSCSGAATGCSLSVSTVGLAAGASDTVTLGFTGSAAAGDSGRITLTARS